MPIAKQNTEIYYNISISEETKELCPNKISKGKIVNNKNTKEITENKMTVNKWDSWENTLTGPKTTPVITGDESVLVGRQKTQERSDLPE